MFGESAEPAEEQEEAVLNERIVTETDDIVRADEQLAPQQRFHVWDVSIVDAEDSAN